MTPTIRFFKLLQMDRKDIYQIFFYAIFAGLVSLSLPLGVQAIINFIQSGRISVSWIVLVFFVVLGVALVGFLAFMQLRITENLQQKIFIRSSFEFAYKLPKIKFEDLYQQAYAPELANRFFDTISIQKGISKILLDFSSALLQIGFGIILLSLYHPFFIVFGLLLIGLLYMIFKYSYNEGVNTSLKESKYKYQVADWLQEIARNKTSFRNQNNSGYALKRNDSIVSNYLSYREKHFAVIKRQFGQLIFFKIIITSGLLLLGGYLVISQQMNIGQFVASEIVILLVINSVEKIILGLETLYDVLTSLEKIGQVTDMEFEPETDTEATSCYTTINLEVENISVRFPNNADEILKEISLHISQGEKIVLSGKNGSGKTTLIRILSGILSPTSGAFFVNDDTFRKINLDQYRSQIATITQGETPFIGTLLENITFNDPTVTDEDIRWAINGAQLASYFRFLPDGLETEILQDGNQLSSSNAQKILIARSIVKKPKVLFYEDPTERMDDETAKQIIDFICQPEHKWTVVVTSKNPYWQEKASRSIIMDKGRIINDQTINHA